MFMLYVYFNALEVLQWLYVLVRLDRMFESRGYLVHIMSTKPYESRYLFMNISYEHVSRYIYGITLGIVDGVLNILTC